MVRLRFARRNDDPKRTLLQRIRLVHGRRLAPAIMEAAGMRSLQDDQIVCSTATTRLTPFRYDSIHIYWNHQVSHPFMNTGTITFSSQVVQSCPKRSATDSWYFSKELPR